MSYALRVSALSALLASPLALGGCNFETVFLAGDPATPQGATDTAMCIDEGLDTGDGALTGNYAGVVIPEGTPTNVQGWMPAERFNHVELLVEGPQGASAAMVDVFGNLASSSFWPGETATYRIDDNPGLAFVTVVGCFGPEAGIWTEEGHADEVTITVEGDPQDSTLRTIHFEATFNGNNGGQSGTLKGSFEVSARPSETPTECPEGWD